MLKRTLITAISLLALTTSSTLAATCDRACLSGLADKLLASFPARNPDSLPLTLSYKATENSVPAAVNMMVLWRTATAVNGHYYAIDTEAQQVFFETTVSEGPSDTFVFGRIKAQDGKIAELEIYSNRSRGQGGFQYGPEGPANLPVEWTQNIPADRLPTRAELLTVGKSIFDTAYDGPPPSPDCVLMENGKPVEEDAHVATQVAGGAAPETPKGKAYVVNPNGTVPIPCGTPPARPTDPKARVAIIDEVQGVVVSLAVVHGTTFPYLATRPVQSAFVPDQIAAPYENLLRDQEAKGMNNSPAPVAMRATGAVVQAERVYDGHLQGMQLLVNLGAPGSASPWVTLE